MVDITALFDLSYGLYVVGAAAEGKRNGQIANAVIQITAEPATVAVSIHKQNLTHTLVEQSGFFSVSTLTTDAPMELIGLFGFKSGKNIDKFASTPYFSAANGSPVLREHCASWLECRVLQTADVGTHTIFIGELCDAGLLTRAEPMTYEYYHRVKKGLAPKTAPTYLAGRIKKPAQPAVPVFRCKVCGYVYDPAVGDPDHGVAPGTPFEALPAGWKCPLCSAAKDAFEPVKQ